MKMIKPKLTNITHNKLSIKLHCVTVINKTKILALCNQKNSLGQLHSLKLPNFLFLHFPILEKFYQAFFHRKLVKSGVKKSPFQINLSRNLITQTHLHYAHKKPDNTNHKIKLALSNFSRCLKNTPPQWQYQISSLPDIKQIQKAILPGKKPKQSPLTMKIKEPLRIFHKFPILQKTDISAQQTRYTIKNQSHHHAKPEIQQNMYHRFVQNLITPGNHPENHQAYHQNFVQQNHMHQKHMQQNLLGLVEKPKPHPKAQNVAPQWARKEFDQLRGNMQHMITEQITKQIAPLLQQQEKPQIQDPFLQYAARNASRFIRF